MRKRSLSTHRCTSRQRGSLPSMCEDACPCAYSHSEQQSCCMVNQHSFFCRVTYPSPVFYSVVHTFLLSSPQMIQPAKQKREKERHERSAHRRLKKHVCVAALFTHRPHISVSLGFPSAVSHSRATACPYLSCVCGVCVGVWV